MDSLYSADIEAKLKLLPDRPGVYLMKNADGKVIYVGKAISLRNRVRSYFQKSQSNSAKVQLMVSHIADIDWIVTENEVEALLLECNLIKKYVPKYNIRLRDDKHYPYLCVTTSEPFPRVLVARRVKQDKNRYFGPYADASAMRESLKIIRKVFKIRSCNKKLIGGEHDKPCLNFHLGQCEAPCSGRISAEEYAEMVRNMCSFLSGHQNELAEYLEQQMKAASDNLEFEKAARYRDQVLAIRSILEKQTVITPDLVNRDIIAAIMNEDSAFVQLFIIRSGKLIGKEHFLMDGAADESLDAVVDEFIKQYYRQSNSVPKEILVSHEPPERELLEAWLSDVRGDSVKITEPKRGEKYQLVKMALDNAFEVSERELQLQMGSDATVAQDLEDLRLVLGLEKIPSRIEAYDNSNIQGHDAVSSMVVFKDGIPAKSEYRRFKIKMSDHPDDYANMREIMRRRFAEIECGNKKFSEKPDLILIDGGLGQLNAAYEAMTASGYDIPMISLAKRLEEIYTTKSGTPLLLPRDSHALRLLQRIRDEAHRFAITYHKTLRNKSTRKSVLDSIPGVGSVRRKALIRKFGSVAGVRKASLEELSSVPGVTRQVAQAIYDHFNN